MNKREMLDKATALVAASKPPPKGHHWIAIAGETDEMELLDVKTITKYGKLAVHSVMGRFIVSDLSCGLQVASFRVKTHARSHIVAVGMNWSAQDLLAKLGI